MPFLSKEQRPLWVYHPTESPKVIQPEELESYLMEGWDESPAPFICYSDLGLDEQKIRADDTMEKMKAEQALLTITALRDYLNDVINLDVMRKSELQEFAANHFDMKLKRQQTLKQMREKIRSRIGGDC